MPMPRLPRYPVTYPGMERKDEALEMPGSGLPYGQDVRFRIPQVEQFSPPYRGMTGPISPFEINPIRPGSPLYSLIEMEPMMGGGYTPEDRVNAINYILRMYGGR